MLPRLPRKLRIALPLIFVIFACCTPQLKATATAQRGEGGPGGAHLSLSRQYGTSIPPNTVRYHFGDDPNGKLGWADSAFDDQSWPIAEQVR